MEIVKKKNSKHGDIFSLLSCENVFILVTMDGSKRGGGGRQRSHAPKLVRLSFLPPHWPKESCARRMVKGKGIKIQRLGYFYDQ